MKPIVQFFCAALLVFEAILRLLLHFQKLRMVLDNVQQNSLNVGPQLPVDFLLLLEGLLHLQC